MQKQCTMSKCRLFMSNCKKKAPRYEVLMCLYLIIGVRKHYD